MSVTLNATDTLAQNGMTTTDFPAASVEFMMDDCLNTVNLLAEQTMDALSSGSVTITRAQSVPVKMLISLVLRENKKTQLSNSTSTGSSSSTAKSIGVGSISVSESGSVSSAISAASTINNPANSVYVEMFYKACNALKRATETSPPIYIANAE